MRRDPHEARRRVIAALRNPPTLTFQKRHPLRLRCEQPTLERPPARHGDTSASRQHQAITRVKEILGRGISKLEYGKTSRSEWLRYFRFANDTLGRDSVGFTCIKVDNEAKHYTDFINVTARTADDWFLNRLVPLLDGKAKASAYVLGEPGAGKSTLLKYLINLHAPFLAERRIVFSRFEFMKFSKRWLKKTTDIKYSLELYISYILLRDVLRTLQYVHRSDGTCERVHLGPFSHDRVESTLREAVGARTLIDQSLTETIKNAAVVINGACGHAGIHAEMLATVPHHLRVFIVAYFAGFCELALVIDGLDCVSLEDSQFDSERTRVVETISDHAQDLTSFSLWDFGERAQVNVPVTTIFVMRENTFYLYRDNIDIPQKHIPTFYVKEIHQDVVMFNVIVRATDEWANQQGIVPSARRKTREALWKATSAPLRYISGRLQLRRSEGSLFDLFGGNIRTSFYFIERLLDWFVDDAVASGLLELRELSSPEDIVNAMSGEQGWRLLKRRNYRILELLLFGREGWFENAIVVLPRSTYGRSLGGSDIPQLRDNGDFSGFVDNIFNYHVLEHGSRGNDHHLVEKVRIVQLLDGVRLSEPELETELRRRLGFESIDTRRTLIVLARSQMVRVHVDRNLVTRFSASPRGIICAIHLAKSMSYLEHIFHRTLFPSELIHHVRDSIRSSGVEKWTIRSIRNIFIFLAYLKFVEQNSDCGRPVPERLRIYAGTAERVVAVVKRILSPGAIQRGGRLRGGGSADIRWEDIAIATERLIDNTLSDWERLGLLDTSLS